MTTVCGKDSRDSISEENLEVMAITSSAVGVDNSLPDTGDKSVNTDQTYLSSLSVRN